MSVLLNLKLSAEIQEKFDQAAKEIKESYAEMDDLKLNRSALADLFVEIAMRISGDHALY